MVKPLWWVLATVWFFLVVAGSLVLMNHALTPAAPSREIPESWPSGSGLSQRAGFPTLVMFAHPQCPCTAASVGELAEMLARCPGQLDAQVVFLRPEGTGEDWAMTGLWRDAAAIPGVTVRGDEDGRMAEAFRAVTSGQVVLYDQAGKLVFSGGITDARGHMGDNAGSEAVVAFVKTGTASPSTTPVFGCALQENAPTNAAVNDL